MSIISELQNKKLGLFELIAIGFELYLKHFRSFLSLLCVVFLPFAVILSFLSLSLSSNPYLLIPFWLYYIFFYLFVIPVYTIALAIFTEDYVTGGKPQLNIVIKRILFQIVPLSGLNLRFGGIFFLRFLLLIIPGIIYATNNGYYAFAFILRDQRGKAAFQYSRSLVKGNWWKLFYFSLLILLVSFGSQTFVNKILSIIANSPDLVYILSLTLSSLVGLGLGISGVLLFLNLDFQKR